MRDKADLMRESRKRREDAGLVPVTSYILPEHKGRLAKYVNLRLRGECNPKGLPQTPPSPSKRLRSAPTSSDDALRDLFDDTSG